MCRGQVLLEVPLRRAAPSRSQASHTTRIRPTRGASCSNNNCTERPTAWLFFPRLSESRESRAGGASPAVPACALTRDVDRTLRYHRSSSSRGHGGGCFCTSHHGASAPGGCGAAGVRGDGHLREPRHGALRFVLCRADSVRGFETQQLPVRIPAVSAVVILRTWFGATRQAARAHI